ncbi:hypothetical protein REJ83_018375 [Clostridioides difficile]|nr:hypothetical protein [Clostridioides difficile]
MSSGFDDACRIRREKLLNELYKKEFELSETTDSQERERLEEEIQEIRKKFREQADFL